MNETKVNLSIIVPGAVMLSEQECSRKLKKPVLDKSGRQIKDKNGNRIFKTVVGPDTAKMTKHLLKVRDSDGSTTLVYYTRNCRDVMQSINITEEAYDYYTSKEAPQGFKNIPMWLSMGKKKRLEWHLNEIAKGLGGVVASYTVFED